MLTNRHGDVFRVLADLKTDRFLAKAQAMRAVLVAQARRHVGCGFLAEDVVQDVMLRVLGSEVSAGVESVEGYLMRMVRNLAIDRARRLGFEHKIFATDKEGYWCPAAGGACPAAAVEGCQALRIVEAAMRELPERVHRAFRLHRIDGMAQKDIAQAMGISRALVCEFVRRGHEHCLKAIEAGAWGAGEDAERDLPRRRERRDESHGSARPAVCDKEKRSDGAGDRLGERAAQDDAVETPKRRQDGKWGQQRIALRGERKGGRTARRSDGLEEHERDGTER